MTWPTAPGRSGKHLGTASVPVDSPFYSFSRPTVTRRLIHRGRDLLSANEPRLST